MLPYYLLHNRIICYASSQNVSNPRLLAFAERRSTIEQTYQDDSLATRSRERHEGLRSATQGGEIMALWDIKLIRWGEGDEGHITD